MENYAAVVGTFDGVHTGHRYLLDVLKGMARSRGLSTRVYTFTDHPLATLCPAKAPGLLTTVSEKRALLDSLGIDGIVVSEFGDVASMTARRYIEMLAGQGVKLLLVGHDNRFGSDGLVEFGQFVEAACGTGVEIKLATELTTPDGREINSSRIRGLIGDRKMREAAGLLGYPYSMTGTVVHGRQLGRTIGFPTANLELGAASRKLRVPAGVYACRALVDGAPVAAMVNIGHRPTVDSNDSPTTIEAHLIDYHADLYGRPLTLEFVDFMRAEQRYSSLDELRQALSHDREVTVSLVVAP